MLTGRCLCGNVTFTAKKPTENGLFCHCTQCRKQSGHYWASATVPVADIAISGDVRWFAASTFARRGFCPTCGSFLFWQHNDSSHIGFSLGAIDGPTGVTMEKHIFVADKGDYYTITDGLPQQERDQ